MRGRLSWSPCRITKRSIASTFTRMPPILPRPSSSEYVAAPASPSITKQPAIAGLIRPGSAFADHLFAHPFRSICRHPADGLAAGLELDRFRPPHRQ
jgi:hypothetical protein